MSERLTDHTLRQIIKWAPICESCAAEQTRVGLDLRTIAKELLTRRVADAKPAPIEQGTLRDVLAGRAMASLLACFGWPCDTEEMARLAYVCADAMLAQRAKETEKP